MVLARSSNLINLIMDLGSLDIATVPMVEVGLTGIVLVVVLIGKGLKKGFELGQCIMSLASSFI